MSPLLLVALLAGPLDELEALAASARATPISGPPPGHTLTRKQEDAVILGHIKARLGLVAEAERRAAPLLASGDPEIAAGARLILGELHADMAVAILESAVPSYLTEDQAELYRLALADKAYPEQQKAKGAALEVLHARPDPPLDAWRLWLRVDSRLVPPRELTCLPPSPPWEGEGRRPHAEERLNRLSRALEHLRADLATWGGCLPEEVTALGAQILEVGEPVVLARELDMVSEILPFVDDGLGQVHDALRGGCGVADHGDLPARAPPPPAPEPLPPLPDRAAFDAALALAIQDPATAPQPPCPWTQARSPTAQRLGAILAVQDRAGTDPATRAALARAWTQVSEGLVAGLGVPELVHGASAGLATLEAATEAASQADALWEAILRDPATSEAERAEAAEALVALTRWRLLIHGLALPPTDYERRRVVY